MVVTSDYCIARGVQICLLINTLVDPTAARIRSFWYERGIDKGVDPRMVAYCLCRMTEKVVTDGIKAGEIIAMANPEAKPGTKQKKSEEKGGSGGPMNALPGGKS